MIRERQKPSEKATGIFGGTFDPIHIGHLIVADHVREAAGLESVIFVPSAVSPHKQGRDVTPGDHRLEMIRLAVGEHAGLGVSDVELRRGGVSYTVETLELLRESSKGLPLVLLIGADNLAEFGTWREPERILALARVIVMTRPGHAVADHPLVADGRVDVCPVPDIEVSASDVRARVRSGRSVRYLVPDAVERYIVLHRLYGEGS